jgi:hypothetical protein
MNCQWIAASEALRLSLERYISSCISSTPDPSGGGVQPDLDPWGCSGVCCQQCAFALSIAKSRGAFCLAPKRHEPKPAGMDEVRGLHGVGSKRHLYSPSKGHGWGTAATGRSGSELPIRSSAEKAKPRVPDGRKDKVPVVYEAPKASHTEDGRGISDPDGYDDKQKVEHNSVDAALAALEKALSDKLGLPRDRDAAGAERTTRRGRRRARKGKKEHSFSSSRGARSRTTRSRSKKAEREASRASLSGSSIPASKSQKRKRSRRKSNGTPESHPSGSSPTSTEPPFRRYQQAPAAFLPPDSSAEYALALSSVHFAPTSSQPSVQSLRYSDVPPSAARLFSEMQHFAREVAGLTTSGSASGERGGALEADKADALGYVRPLFAIRDAVSEAAAVPSLGSAWTKGSYNAPVANEASVLEKHAVPPCPGSFSRQLQQAFPSSAIVAPASPTSVEAFRPDARSVEDSFSAFRSHFPSADSALPSLYSLAFLGPPMPLSLSAQLSPAGDIGRNDSAAVLGKEPSGHFRMPKGLPGLTRPDDMSSLSSFRGGDWNQTRDQGLNPRQEATRSTTPQGDASLSYSKERGAMSQSDETPMMLPATPTTTTLPSMAAYAPVSSRYVDVPPMQQASPTFIANGGQRPRYFLDKVDSPSLPGPMQALRLMQRIKDSQAGPKVVDGTERSNAGVTNTAAGQRNGHWEIGPQQRLAYSDGGAIHPQDSAFWTLQGLSFYQ